MKARGARHFYYPLFRCAGCRCAAIFLDIALFCKNKTAMKLTFASLFIAFACLLLGESCKQEPLSVNIDIDIQDPQITTLQGGAKKLDFTVVVTQLGNFYHEEFQFQFKKFGNNSPLIDSFQVVLPTAREFVRRTVTVPQGGDYWVEAQVGTSNSGASTGTLIKVPE